MKIYAFADEASPSIDEQIAAMKRNGLNGLEIRGVDGENVSVISLNKAREVRRKLEDAGLSVWSIGSPIGKIDIKNGDFDAQMEKKVRAAIEDALQIQNRETKIEEEMAARVNVLKDISASMARELGREATLAELAERMKMSEDEIRDIMKLTMDAMKVSGQAAEMAQKEIDEQE